MTSLPSPRIISMEVISMKLMPYSEYVASGMRKPYVKAKRERSPRAVTEVKPAKVNPPSDFALLVDAYLDGATQSVNSDIHAQLCHADGGCMFTVEESMNPHVKWVRTSFAPVHVRPLLLALLNGDRYSNYVVRHVTPTCGNPMCVSPHHTVYEKRV